LKGWEKRARQLLLNPAGRAALKQYGIDVEVVQDKQPDKDRPIVAVLCPTYRAPEPQMKDALLKMLEYTREKDAATVYTAAPLSASIVHWTRNWLISDHINSGKPWTHVLFIDDDIVPEPDALVRLLSHKKDIVAGLCTARQDPPVPNMKTWNKERGEAEKIWDWPEGKLIDGVMAGTGLMLISKHALEQVAQVYFDCLWEQDVYGFSGEKLAAWKAARLKRFDDLKSCYWFRILPTPSGDVEMGEDMNFCYIAKTYCGIETHVDTSVQPGHIGKYPFSIRDFVPHRDECILRAKINGQYQMEVPPMKISILCPTRGRPEMVKNFLASLLATSSEAPEVVLYVDDDDSQTTGPSINGDQSYPIDKLIMLRGPRILMTEMWNRCSEAATGEILLLSGDDVLFRTKGWDDQVRRAFAAFPDRLILVHGDDGVHGNRFGTHCFLHRAWVDAVGYFSPPYFSSDYGDTWINDVFNALDRRIFLPIVTEHLHPIAGKRQPDKTDKERLERHKRDDVEKLYKDLEPERIADIRKVAARLNIPWESHVNDYAYKSCTD
jgi:glycosyltransferase involved in cell wall biosynthesis